MNPAIDDEWSEDGAPLVHVQYSATIRMATSTRATPPRSTTSVLQSLDNACPMTSRAPTLAYHWSEYATSRAHVPQ